MRTRTSTASPWTRRTGWGSTWRRGLDRSLAQGDHDGKLGTPDHHTLGAEPSVMLRVSTNLWYGMVSGSLPMPTLLPGGWAPNGASFRMDGSPSLSPVKWRMSRRALLPISPQLCQARVGYRCLYSILVVMRYQ